MKIYLNNILFTDIANDGLTESIELNSEDGSIEYGVSSTFTTTGSHSYNYIYDFFFKNLCDSLHKEIDARIVFENKCKLEENYKLRIDGIRLCEEDCKIEFNLIHVPKDEEQYLCLKNQVSYGKSKDFKDFISSRSFKIPYCQDMTMITYLLMYIYQITIKTIVTILQFICAGLDTIGLGGGLCNLLDRLENAITGCNKYHTAALLSDVYEYNAKLCGLEFKSSIFQDNEVYKCTAIETAISGEGYYIHQCNDSDKQWNESNAENLNLLQLSKIFSVPFNAEFRIIDGKLCFERRDYFYNISKPILNLESEYKNGRIEQCPEISIDQSKVCAYLKLQFTEDGFDLIGNKLKNEYNEIIEWNPTGNKNTKGECLKTFQLGMSAFLNDQRVEINFENRALAYMRQSNGIIGTGTCDFKHWQVIQDGQFSEIKLLIVDKINTLTCSSCKFYSTIRKKIGSVKDIFIAFGDVDVYSYNDPLKGQALYDNFHYIDDPKNNMIDIVELGDIKWTPTDFCDAVQFIRKNGLLSAIESDRFGKSIPTSIEINYDECTISFKGLKFRCKK